MSTHIMVKVDEASHNIVQQLEEMYQVDLHDDW